MLNRIEGTFNFNLAITEDLKVIQAKFKELTVQGLHDDITITAHRRQDFGKLMEAAKVMKPVLFGQGSRMNMAKTRFVYYGESELTEEVTEAIREAGVRFVNKLRFNHGGCGQKVPLHTWNACGTKYRDAIAGMVLQDVKEKAMSLHGANQAPACLSKMPWLYSGGQLLRL